MARTVLLVDDDIAEISAVKRVLARAGHRPVLATNASDALAVLGQSRPDLVVIGSTCEGGEALALTHRLQEDTATSDVPVVVLGSADGAAAGAVQLPRPVDAEALAAHVAAVLGAAAPEEKAAPAAAPPNVAVARKAAPAARPTAVASGAPAAARVRRTAPAPSPDPAAADRRAAADALRARADELRRGAPGRAATAPASPAGSPAAPAAIAGDDASGLDVVLRRAEELERAHAAERKARARQEDRAKVEAAQRVEAERLAVEKARRADAEARRARELEAKAAAEERARAAAEAARAKGEERRADEARRAQSAEERARAESSARHQLEEELTSLRDRLEAERSRHEEELQTVLERAVAEEKAADEIRRMAEEEAEEQLREAIESARSEMEALRKKGEDEARRRAAAEAEVQRLSEDASRLAGARAALAAPLPEPSPEEEARRRFVQSLREDRGRSGAPEYEPPAWLEASAAASRPRAAQRPPTAPDELQAGDLSELPAPRLLALAARAALGGRIDFAGADPRSLWFEEGRVVGATSAAPTERVEEVAVRIGLVTRDQYRQVVGAASTLPTRRAAVLLLERGFLKPNELTPLVRRRTEEVVFGVFAETEGRFRWSASEVPADERIALERGSLALAVEGVRRRWLADRVDAVLGGHATLLAAVPDAPAADDLGLSAAERRALALADGLRTIDEIVAASPLDALTTRQVLAALVLVGALAVRIHQAGRPQSAAAAAIDLARVREKLDQVRRADYFTILGVGRLCTPHEVRDAAGRLLAEFDPRRFAGLAEEGLPAKLEEIGRVVLDAREVLADGKLRDAYLSGLGG